MPALMPGKGRRHWPATYRITLAYDGRKFHGYARQPGRVTVEGAIRSALASYFYHRPPALGVGGRTDRGVHAVGQVVSFRLAGPVPELELQDALDGVEGLSVLDVRRVPHWFHAGFSARSRSYVYLADKPPPVAIDRLRRQLTALLGRRCFSAFARHVPHGRSTERRLMRASVHWTSLDGQPRLRFDVQADGFLRRMVRVLVATSLTTAHEGRSDDALVALAASGNRAATSAPGPAEHLYLAAVHYDPEPVRHVAPPAQPRP